MHGAKCYVEGASGALGKTRQACTGAEVREAEEGVPAKRSRMGKGHWDKRTQPAYLGHMAWLE